MLENLKPYTQGEQATLVALNKKNRFVLSCERCCKNALVPLREQIIMTGSQRISNCFRFNLSDL